MTPTHRGRIGRPGAVMLAAASLLALSALSACGAILGLDVDGLSPRGPAEAGALADAAASSDAPPSLDAPLETGALPAESVTVAFQAPLAGAISLAVADDGEALVGWLEASTRNHLHLARISGGSPRVTAEHDEALSLSGEVDVAGMGVSVFAPKPGCFGVVWGEGELLLAAAVTSEARPRPMETVAYLSGRGRLGQVRTAASGAGGAVIAWSDLPAFAGEAPGGFRSGELSLDGCRPGTFASDLDDLSDRPLSLLGGDAPARPEFAIAQAGSVSHFAAQRTRTGGGSELTYRQRSPDRTLTDAVSLGGHLGAWVGGSVAVAAVPGGVAAAHVRRNAGTDADIVVTTTGAGGSADTVLERGIWSGTSVVNHLEVTRLAIGSGPHGIVLVAAFARGDGSELIVYTPDAAAPTGFRSQLLARDVIGGRRGKDDSHVLLDAVVDRVGRVHVVWRSGTTHEIVYSRLTR